MITYARRSLRLYLANRNYVLGVPVLTLGLMVVISILNAVIIGIGTGFPLSAQVQDGFRSNSGVIWAIPGFLVSVGVLAATRNFAMALAFGSTRRHFWLGTMAGFVATATVTGAAAMLLLGMERLTNHWFIGAHALDVAVLGDGNIATTFAVVFVLVLLSTTAGAMFGMVYRAYGPKATTLLVIGCLLLVFVAVAIGMWQRDAVGPMLAQWGAWAGVIVGSGLVVVTSAGSYAACRLATV